MNDQNRLSVGSGMSRDGEGTLHIDCGQLLAELRCKVPEATEEDVVRAVRHWCRQHGIPYCWERGGVVSPVEYWEGNTDVQGPPLPPRD